MELINFSYSLNNYLFIFLQYIVDLQPPPVFNKKFGELHNTIYQSFPESDFIDNKRKGKKTPLIGMCLSGGIR